MFRLRLHPTPSGLLFGFAVIAFWALLWLWFFSQLSPRGTAGRQQASAREVAGLARPGEHTSTAVASASRFQVVESAVRG
jgi:hypothetical protein